MRAIEERILLLRQMAEFVSEVGGQEVAAQCRSEAEAAEQRVKTLHDMVLDGKLFGRGPEEI